VNLEDWYEVHGEKSGVDSRDEGKHTGRNDLLYVEKMMLMNEPLCPGMKSEFHVDFW